MKKGNIMKHDMNHFIAEILSTPKRKAIPIMTSPGFELIGASPAEVFRDGELQFRCIEALSREVRADALVTFMDLSVEAEAFGAPIQYSEHENPTVTGRIVDGEAAIRALAVPGVGAGRTAETLKCARLCAENIGGRPIFGGIIGPFSLAGRLADMTEIMILALAEPEAAALLLDKVTDFLAAYARAVKECGLDGLVIAEPAAGLLSPEMCRDFSAAYLKRIIAEVQDDRFKVILHNCGKTEKQIPELLSTGAAMLHLGNAVNLPEILPQIPAATPLLGNIDPVGVFKNADSDTVYAATMALLEATRPFANFALSSGCDIPPGVPMANIRAFFRAADDYNARQ